MGGYGVDIVNVCGCGILGREGDIPNVEELFMFSEGLF